MKVGREVGECGGSGGWGRWWEWSRGRVVGVEQGESGGSGAGGRWWVVGKVVGGREGEEGEVREWMESGCREWYGDVDRSKR